MEDSIRLISSPPFNCEVHSVLSCYGLPTWIRTTITAFAGPHPIQLNDRENWTPRQESNLRLPRSKRGTLSAELRGDHVAQEVGAAPTPRRFGGVVPC
jgi:hypothetical protein